MLQVRQPPETAGPDPLAAGGVCAAESGDAESVREGEVYAQRSGWKSGYVLKVKVETPNSRIVNCISRHFNLRLIKDMFIS